MFKPLEARRAFEAVTEQIKGLVCSGQLKPGDKLPTERELATLVGTGRMVVRESLRLLEHSGFVQIKNGYKGGVFVKDVGAEVMTGSIVDLVKLGRISLEQLTETRIEIESAIIGLAAARIDDDDLEKLRKNIEHTEQLISEGKISRDGNVTFHLILAQAAKNPLLEIIIESIMNVVDSVVNWLKPTLSDSERILKAHKAIYDALRKKEVGSARKLMRDHLVDVGAMWSLWLRSRTNK
jgi:GntR family transcriptional regulator, transcriptional repressor for pyruvate dehydrogenase complex